MINARALAEQMYERRRRYEGLRSRWGGLRPYQRRGMEIMAEAAIDAMTMALMRHAIAKGVGGLPLRRNLEAITSDVVMPHATDAQR